MQRPDGIQHHHPMEARAGFSVKDAAEWSGMSRSALYRAAGEGRLTLRKAGRTTIVDGASLAALVDGLPFARIGTAQHDA